MKTVTADISNGFIPLFTSVCENFWTDGYHSPTKAVISNEASVVISKEYLASDHFEFYGNEKQVKELGGQPRLEDSKAVGAKISQATNPITRHIIDFQIDDDLTGMNVTFIDDRPSLLNYEPFTDEWL